MCRVIMFVWCVMNKVDEHYQKQIKNTACDCSQTAYFGGEGGIRTLDELSTHTRVPVVRHKPG